MSTVVNPLAPRRGRADFGTLTAGMVLRGAVPAQVLYGAAPALRQSGPACVVELAPAEAPVAAAPASTPSRAKPPASGANKTRRAMTVRLDPVHHMRLRLVSSYLKQSSQEIFVAALEAYFKDLPVTVPGNCACLRARLEASTK